MHSLLWRIIGRALSVTTGFVLVCRDGYVRDNGDVRLWRVIEEEGRQIQE